MGEELTSHLHQLRGMLAASENSHSPIDECLRLITCIVRRACANCDEHAAEVASLANSIQEEWNDVDVRNGSVVERQRVMQSSGRGEDARLLGKAAQAANIVMAGLVHLHAHSSHARPERTLVQPEVFRVSQRM